MRVKLVTLYTPCPLPLIDDYISRHVRGPSQKTNYAHLALQNLDQFKPCLKMTTRRLFSPSPPILHLLRRIFQLSFSCRLASLWLELGNQVRSTTDHLTNCCLSNSVEDLNMMRLGHQGTTRRLSFVYFYRNPKGANNLDPSGHRSGRLERGLQHLPGPRSPGLFKISRLLLIL